MTFYGPLAFGYDPQDAPDECGHGLCDVEHTEDATIWTCLSCGEVFTMRRSAAVPATER